MPVCGQAFNGVEIDKNEMLNQAGQDVGAAVTSNAINQIEDADEE